MWVLVSKTEPEKKHVLVGGKKYVIGRQSCDIVVQDPSVSRTQAELSLFHQESNVMKSFVVPELMLEDVSKFGTFVNGKAVRKSGPSQVSLKSGDEIRFGGTLASVYIAKYEPFIVTASCIEKGPKKALQKTMCALGGHLVRDWRTNCELLVMPKINVTIKVVCALNNQRHIVTPDYLEDLLSFYLGNREKPNPKDYLPEVVDQEVPPGVCFHPDERRETLLNGIKFYFLSAVQFNKTNLAVSTAGGQPILLEDGTEEDAKAMTGPGTVVFAVNRESLVTLSPACQKFVQLVYSFLSKKKLRLVSDPEVGWAILTCNIEQFCNPTSEITPSMYSAVATQMTQCDSQMMTTTTQMEVDHTAPGHRSSGVDKKSSASSLNRSVPRLESQMDEGSEQKPVTPPPRNSSARAGRSRRVSPKPDSEATANPVDSKTPQERETSRPAGSESDKNDNVVSVSGVRDSVVSASEGKSSLRFRLSGDLFSSSTGNSTKVPPDEGSREKAVSERANSSEEKETISVFARQRKNGSKPTLVRRDSSDDDDVVNRGNRRSVKRKAMFSYDDEEEEKEENARPVKRLGKKFVFETEEDSNSTTAPAGDTELHEVKDSEEDISRERRDTSRVVVDSVVNDSEMDDIKPEVSAAPGDWLSVATSVRVKPEPSCSGDGARRSFNRDVDTEDSERDGISGAVPADTHSDVQGLEDDVKPQMEEEELLLDNAGNPLRNFCEVKMVNLLARPIGSKAVRNSSKGAPSTSSNGLKNFKKFRKTEHAGTGKLPTIIGGRDLEVYLGNRHKDIEDLFSVGLAEENRQRMEDKRNQDLFDWDSSKSKKPAVKKRR
ncbi:nibrin [Aplysia californica]|uniref:Nibrin n=1 Tax=Aplysia californica TaxID=6500 RepID=A0ABM0JRG0_APLCA|nr:nibrin [Aplysia californica]